MTPFIIEDQVPLPKRQGGRAPLYPFGDIKVGQSFLVKCSKKEKKDKLNAVSSSASGWASRHESAKFRTAMVPGGVRVWRIA